MIEGDSLSGYQLGLGEDLAECSPVCHPCVTRVCLGALQFSSNSAEVEYEKSEAQRGNASRPVLSQESG